MDSIDRLTTDYALLGYSTGKHPMALWREGRDRSPSGPQGTHASADRAETSPPDGSESHPCPHRASDLHALHHGSPVTIAGMVICRQRPGTAKGHCFISLEDETGIANLFVPRDTFQQYRLVITTERFLLCRGRLQISEGGQPTVYTTGIDPLPFPTHLDTSSHDFH